MSIWRKGGSRCRRCLNLGASNATSLSWRFFDGECAHYWKGMRTNGALCPRMLLHLPRGLYRPALSPFGVATIQDIAHVALFRFTQLAPTSWAQICTIT